MKKIFNEFMELSKTDKFLIIRRVTGIFFNFTLSVAMIAFIIATAISYIKSNHSNNLKPNNTNFSYESIYKPSKYYSFEINSDGCIVFSPIDEGDATSSEDTVE